MGSEPDLGVEPFWLRGLGVGVALLEASTWRVQFENDTFATWFPEGSSEKSPLSRFPGFHEDRARKRLEKGRPYSFDSEIKIGSKPTCLRTTVTSLDGKRVMFECIDVSKEKQQEHMLDSFAKLADRRNRELEKAYKVIKEQNEKMKRDLEAAARVQQSYLPSTLPPTDRAQFAWAYRPCDELAGDIFNVVQIDDRHVGMYVVDVSGHGVPSALLAVSVARNLIPHSDRSSLVVEPDADGQEHLVVGPADVASRLNGLYRMDEKNRYYFTLLLRLAGHARGTVSLRQRRAPWTDSGATIGTATHVYATGDPDRHDGCIHLRGSRARSPNRRPSVSLLRRRHRGNKPRRRAVRG